MIYVLFALCNFVHKMDPSIQARKKRLVVILIIFLELLNDFTLFFVMVICVILQNEMRKRRRIRYDYHIKILVRNVNFHRIVF